MSTNPLHVAADRLNALYNAAEFEITALDLGVSASVPVPLGAANARDHLAFGKFDGKWRLAIESVDGTWQPIANAPRALRIEAAACLPGLVEALERAHGDNAADAVRAISLVEKFVTKLHRVRVGPAVVPHAE